MATALLVLIAIVLFAAAAGIVLFAHWLGKSWTVVAEDDAHEAGEGGTFWAQLRRLFGRGPRRLSYRRDEKGRFRKHRR